MSDKQRIIDLQKQVKIARAALERLSHRLEHGVADDALYDMLKLDPTVPLAGILGWEGRRG